MKATSVIITILVIGSACPVSAAVNAQNYSRMDKDGDGKWSYQEYVQYRMGGFEKMDKNKDGMVDSSEAWNASFMNSVDADKNGKISRREAETYHAKIAKNVDKDKDGFITFEDLNPKE